MSEISRPERSAPEDAVFDAVLKAGLAGPQTESPSIESKDRARAAVLKSVRRRTQRRLVVSHRRWFTLTVGLLAFLSTLIVGVLIYVILDNPEIQELRAYVLPAQVDGCLLVRSPADDHWIAVSGSTEITVGSVIVASAGKPSRLYARDARLIFELSPGARMRCQKGWQAPLILLQGEVTVELAPREEGDFAAADSSGDSRSMDFVADGSDAGHYIHRLRLRGAGARARLLVDDLYVGMSAQVVAEAGQVAVHRGVSVPTTTVTLQPEEGVVFSGLHVARAALPPAGSELARIGAAVARWPAPHWHFRSGAGALLQEGAGLTLTSQDAISDLRSMAAGARAAPALESRLLAVATLGVLDDYSAVSALIVLQARPELNSACLDSLERFRDPRSRIIIESLLDAGLAERDPDRAASLLLALGRVSFGLREQTGLIESIAANPNLSPRGRIDAMTALAFAKGDAHAISANALDELQGAIARARLEDPASVELALAALAALEELAIRGTPGALARLQAQSDESGSVLHSAARIALGLAMNARPR